MSKIHRIIPLLVLSGLLLTVISVDASKVNPQNFVEPRIALKPAANALPPAVSCKTEVVSDVVYAGQLKSIDVPSQVEPNQLFTIKATIQNTGTVPWFSRSSGCIGQPSTYLGTTRAQDRQSLFFAPAVFGDTKWFNGNRIMMSTPRVNPGQTATFTFTAHAPQQPGFYREYFAPVIEGKTWLKDDAEFHFDVSVGQAPEGSDKVLSYTKDIEESLNLLDPSFFGPKRFEVSLSKQTLKVYLGDKVIRTFRVSTGSPKHPTPTGTTAIQFKQEVRVAGSVPHYIMPKFMQFRKGGFGFHALPSLANDHGVFWTEALNHIGEPRSHGCIRLLPADANFVYDFAEVGTEVKVIW